MQESRQSPIMKESIFGSAGGYGVGSHVTYEVSIFLLDLLREIDLYVCLERAVAQRLPAFLSESIYTSGYSRLNLRFF